MSNFIFKGIIFLVILSLSEPTTTYVSVADLGGGWGGCIPPTSLKLTISAEKSASVSINQSPFRGVSPHQPKPNDFGRKISLNFGEDLFFLETTWFWAENQSQFRWRPFFFFFFFGDHLILGGKNVWISDFGRKITLNFGEDIRIFEVLCLKFLLSPLTKIF